MRNGYPRSLLTAFLLLSTASITWGQSTGHWRFWMGDDGLSESCSNSVFQSASGRVWVNHGHVERMSVLDGFTVTNVPSPGVAVPVYENPPGNIWSIYPEGFQRYEFSGDLIDGHWKRFKAIEINSVNVPFFPVTQNQLVFLREDALMIFDAGSLQSNVIRKSSDSRLGRFNYLLSSRERGFWIAGDNGIARYTLADATHPQANWEEFVPDAKLEIGSFSDLLEDYEGGVCATALSNKDNRRVLIQLIHGTWPILHADPDNDVALGWKLLDRLWIFQRPFTLFTIVNGARRDMERNTVLSRVLTDLDIPDAQSFWLATSEGLARYAPAAWRTPPETADLNLVHAIQQDSSGRLWFAFERRLVYCDEDRWTLCPPYRGGQQSQELITDALCLVGDNGVAIKTTGQDESGLMLFDPVSQQYSPIQVPDDFIVIAIAQHDNCNIMVYSRREEEFRLDVFDGQKFEPVIPPTSTPFLDAEIRHLYQNPNGAIWFAGLNGVVRYTNGDFKRFGPDDGYTGTGANCIFPIGWNKIWVGDRDAIYEFDGQSWKLVRSGLDGVRSIAVDRRNGDIWVASRTGLHRFRDGGWITNNYEDGLPNGAVFDVFQDKDNRLWAGTTNGLSLYYPDADPDAPETYIPPESNAYEMAPGGSQIVFHGIDKWNYTRQERLLYSYRLDGAPWSLYSGKTVASIPPLSPGIHAFEVRAVDRNGNVDPTPAVHSFRVLYPWYQEPRVLSILIIGAIVLAISVSVHVFHHLNLERLVTKRTADLTAANRQLNVDATALKTAYGRVRSLASELSLAEEKERRLIAADLHDGIGQTLSLSTIKLEVLQETIQSSEVQNELENVKSLIDRTLQNSRSLTFELCPPILYEVGIEAAFEQLAEQFEVRHGVRIDCDCAATVTPLSEDLRYFLFRATRELLTNAVKHAKVKTVKLSVLRLDKTVQITVEDRGAGFDPTTTNALKRQTAGFGLFSIGERLKHIGGRLTVDSQFGRGTRVTIEAPLDVLNSSTNSEKGYEG